MQISRVMYPSINAKLRGMFSTRIKKEQLEELIKQPTTKQAIDLLKNYNKDFKSLEDNPKRIKINKVLDDILIKDIKKIKRLLSKKDKKIFEYFISIYEIKCIKIVFRKLVSNNHINEPANEIEGWTNNLFKQIQGIENVKDDYEAFLSIIKETKYYQIFSAYSENINSASLFEIENKLDKMYFENMMKLASKYNSELEDIFGRIIDLNNVIWVYRIKKNYKFSEEETKEILINNRYLLKKSEINKLIQSENEIEIKEVLKSTYYSKEIEFDNLENIEELVDKYIYKICKKYFNKDIFNISSIYAYIIMQEKQSNDIVNIIEGIRYNLNSEELRKKLVVDI